MTARRFPPPWSVEELSKVTAKRSLPLTLTTHGVVGGAIVSLIPTHPVLGLCLAFASHYLLDGIPHWDYRIRSAALVSVAPMKYDTALLTDAITISADAVLGVALALLLFAIRGSIALVACGALAAILPDVLQFAYTRFPNEPLGSLQTFHRWAHKSKGIKQPILGIVSQVILLVVIVVAVRTVAPLIK
jgi:hypothetical protein